ncbi:iron-containing alcohol dehydrogenase [Ancylomarina sp. 16SWW S1-10-2]|uniref:iron-containing alcohol dehydrogenase n=1 Tax=Ancylomarina sp. 16SWW S1-10-2 TaxID=2499681 RepID=UPI0012AD294E|nr:iron-containing alcohol dehydrogenase [Ancylomarina sp. 16SWW S1-10-2]MRT92855.1 iron-containing alcohol dehydrogenase [Ancylomarina sp. 16SWW S1-10-2]
MNNFDFYNPVKIIFGKGKIAELKKHIPTDAKILITFGGGSIKKNGVYDQVIAALDGFNVQEFGGIESNPHFETLMKAVEIVKSEKIDFLLAIGGGSVIDGTKFIAAASCYKGEDPWDIPAKHVPLESAINLGAVLTLAATGSEMNNGGVITKLATKEKLSFSSPILFPKFSILDPESTFSLPKRQIANGAADAFVHVIEQYLTYPVNSPVQDRFSEGLLVTLIEEGPKAYDSKTPNYDEYANIMWAATMALNGLIGVGVQNDWATHTIGHELTAFHGIDHAVTLAIVLPGLMTHLKDKRSVKLLQYAERVWHITEGSDEERIAMAIVKTESFFNRLGIKTRLGDHHVGQKTIDRIIKRFKDRQLPHIGMLPDIKIEDAEKILIDRL